MDKYTQHTIYLQDGSLCNFTKRVEKQHVSLVQAFSKVTDGRAKRGIRHQLPCILLILFCGITAGYTTLSDCHLWAVHNRKWLQKVIPLPFGIPDPTTLSRSIQKVPIDSLVNAFITWHQLLFGSFGHVASFDGKTLNGVHGKEVIKHILSLFLHETHAVIGQIGVNQKENEIPALHRLLTQTNVSGFLLVGDALHTQKETVNYILFHTADYLLFVKGNQEQLQKHLALFFTDIPWHKTVQQANYEDNQRERQVTTTITISHDEQIRTYLKQDGWKEIQTVGKIHKRGIRRTADGKETPIEETYYLISSRKLTAEQAGRYTRNHWQIENNLHWEKDWLFLEDRQTLRSGNAPQAMTFLRSVCLSVFTSVHFASPAAAVSNFRMNPTLHHRFLEMAGVVS